MKRKALRVRSEGSIPLYVTEAESRKQHRDAPLCNSLMCPLPASSSQEPRSLSPEKLGLKGTYLLSEK